jgi:site-specific DNA recombinase
VWTLRTVAAILTNPRYTGRQVWRRQSIDHHELRPGDKSSRPAGCKPTRGWNPRDQWVISPPDAHPALVTEETFLRIQQISALAMPDDANFDLYQLTGLVICGLCGRRAEGHWAHGRARYRCRHGRTSASDVQVEHPKTLFVRQDGLIEQATIQLAHLIDTDAASISIEELARQLRSGGSRSSAPGWPSPSTPESQNQNPSRHRRSYPAVSSCCRSRSRVGQRRTPTKTIPQT